MITGTAAGRVFRLEGPETICGRGSSAGIVLTDTGISRNHAKLVKHRNGQVELVDLGSTNGTFIDGTRIRSHTLRDGDRFRLGPDVMLKFSLQDPVEEKLQRQLYERATLDALTQIYNRNALLDRLGEELVQSKRHSDPLSLLMIDVDLFKRVNDTYGHLAGDQVLRSLARRMTEVGRHDDLLARYGGEEFALLARQSADGSVGHAERLRKSIAAMEIDLGEGQVISVTVSIGIATQSASAPYGSWEEFVQLADQALYQAKHAGRNRVVHARDLPGLPT
ncbi:MAG: diguanylate cyclase [Candidatus Xenobia bacterium]